MIESQQVLEWITEGEIKAKVQVLRRLLEKKFPPGPPAELTAVINGCTDLSRLALWFDAAIDARSLDEFRQAMRTSMPYPTTNDGT
ncbi:MAG: hypothetical protein K2R98_05570 [Gemmataceae bacterium]|nr:hypothetical protein [Gemmataceae bacterium]